MQVLSLCQSYFPDKIPTNISNEIGNGADGQVFEIKNHLNKVIKLSIIFDYIDNPINSQYNNVNKTLLYLKNNNIDYCVKIFDYNLIGEGTRNTVNGPQRYLIHYYIMEKLNKISDDEKKVFHSILCHEDRGIKKDYPIWKVQEILKNLSRGLDFEFKKIILFYDKVKNSNLKHLDIHIRNIMKDNDNNFKLIDLDRCQL